MKPFLAALLLSALVGGRQANGCGAPPGVENAICGVSDGTVGSWAYYTCNGGYILYGRNRILCTKNGWTQPSLFCQKIKDERMLGDDAGSHPPSENTETKDERMLGDDDGSHPPSESTVISCGTPPDLENANYSVSEDTIGNWAIYTCNEGYTLKGRNGILCTKNGWSKPSLSCQKIKCNHPPPISSGRVTEGEEWTYGAEASYSCDEGYNLTGQETIHCTDTGAWSHPPPICTVISCGTPPNLENANCSVSDDTFGNWAFYNCNEGYILHGENGIQCTKNGWSKPTLSCQIISCGTPPDLENANCSASDDTFGNWAFYTCNEGHTLQGRNGIQCTKNGWSKPSLSCQKIKCNHPPPISNGRVTEGEEWTYGAEASYSCDEGYTLTGEQTIHCTDTGAWSHPPPLCTVISCGTPPNLENANCSVSEDTIGNWAFYTCNEGHILQGRNGILCTKHGWSKPSLSCQKIKCSHPPPISNGRVTEGEEWTYGAEASYSCDEGYTLTGQETIHCMDTGAWSHPPPLCTGTFVAYSAARNWFSSSFQKPEVIAVVGFIFGVIVVLIIVGLIKRCTKQGSYRITLINEESDSLGKLSVD